MAHTDQHEHTPDFGGTTPNPLHRYSQSLIRKWNAVIEGSYDTEIGAFILQAFARVYEFESLSAHMLGRRSNLAELELRKPGPYPGSIVREFTYGEVPDSKEGSLLVKESVVVTPQGESTFMLPQIAAPGEIGVGVKLAVPRLVEFLLLDGDEQKKLPDALLEEAYEMQNDFAHLNPLNRQENISPYQREQAEFSDRLQRIQHTLGVASFSTVGLEFAPPKLVSTN